MYYLDMSLIDKINENNDIKNKEIISNEHNPTDKLNIEKNNKKIIL